MNMKNVFFGLFWGFAVGICAGILFGAELERAGFKKEAVKQGYAEYNPTNGVWHWKNK